MLDVEIVQCLPDWVSAPLHADEPEFLTVLASVTGDDDVDEAPELDVKVLSDERTCCHHHYDIYVFKSNHVKKIHIYLLTKQWKHPTWIHQ